MSEQKAKRRWKVMRGIHILSEEAPTHGLPPADRIYATGDVFESDMDMAQIHNGRDANMEPKFQLAGESEPVTQRPLSRELTKKVDKPQRTLTQQEKSQAELEKLTADIDPTALPTSGVKARTTHTEQVKK